ncbi:hypothetical protein EPUS_00769 [Endocarpon pusillum Z07020]|uniref:EamA domain-containing protein n=1 Tax=Endocarpon pusillum (strain Z07020 / HMAS-L-300199) TaxID=1263415 RepID=U1HYR3_ENDPU|nr:uncharacterized protein EPUS_00769 [Endocarpon pusillum Z07020]ERF74639.1 hypothetical protein EPUS_00769 [Endocarpon pusillum Z07020]
MSSSRTRPEHWQHTRSSSPPLAQNGLPGPSRELRSKGQSLDIPGSNIHPRPSLESTYSEVSELAVHLGEHRHARQPLLSSPHNNIQRLSPVALATSHHRHGIRGFLDAFWLRNKGVVLVLLAMVFGSGMNVAARLLETDGTHGKAMHPFQILFARMSITVLLTLFYGFYTRIPYFPFGSKVVRLLLIARGVGGFFGVFGLYWSLLYLPLAEATVLTFLAPILTCYACSLLIKGETFSRQQQIAGFLSLVGVVFIARPGSLFMSSGAHHDAGHDPSTVHSNTTSAVSATSPPSSTASQPTQHQHLLAVLFAMVGVLGATTALTTIRKIGTRAHPLISVNYFSSWCTIVSSVAVLAAPSVGFRLPANVQEWGLLIMLGIFGFVMQFLLTAGLAYGGPASSDNKRADGEIHTTPKEVGAVGGDVAYGEDEEAGRESGQGRIYAAQETSADVTAKPITAATAKAAASKGSGTRATSMLYTQMLFALAFDKCIWGISPGWSSWVGSVIILACAVWVAAARDLQTKNTGQGHLDGEHHEDGENFELGEREKFRKGNREHVQERGDEQRLIHCPLQDAEEGGEEDGRS